MRAEGVVKWLWVPVVVLGLYGLHRLALWMEERGWIYYWRRRAGSGALGNAVMGVQQILEPGKKHTLEVRRNPRVRKQHPGGPPKT